MLTSRGLREILVEFAKIGYDAEWQIISKRSLGFEDERERCIVVAYPSQVGRNKSLQVFNSSAYKQCQQTLERKKYLDNQFGGIHSHPLSEETIRELLCSDAGIPPKLVQPYIEAYGDAISPVMAQLIFELIKIHFQFNRTNEPTNIQTQSEH